MSQLQHTDFMECGIELCAYVCVSSESRKLSFNVKFFWKLEQSVQMIGSDGFFVLI